ncbi:MAG: YdcF family protein [Chloroflexota bacterium]|nr:MAG: YdcF family protein [Chloroflexota bacterium]
MRPRDSAPRIIDRGPDSAPGGDSRGGRAIQRLTRLIAAVLFVVAFGSALAPRALAALGQFLIVDEPLRPAAAILVLGGAVPYREMAAADLYRAGWAPRVVLVAAGRTDDQRLAIEALGVPLQDPMTVRQDILVALGVPRSAQIVAPGRADATLDELEFALTSVGDGTEPMILVTSPYHARRVSLYWRHVAGERRPAITRTAWQDGFDPATWWRNQTRILSVSREVMGLANYALGFPIAERAAGRAPAISR